MPARTLLLQHRPNEAFITGWRENIPLGPELTEYYLVDAKTGAVQAVSGEFAPLHQDGKRFLQPTAEPNIYWAAIPGDTKTQVGRYNLKDFSFKSVMTVPHIAFDSMSMWVDEKDRKIYVVYKGQLLRLPLIVQ